MSIKGTRDFRPAYHFTPEKMWTNDPNGMVYVDGKWHLFYQHYPEDTKWGPMHWGHAVSHDLTTWEHLPVALAPDELGLIFSGSAVLDVENWSGFGKEGNPAMVAMYTSTSRTGQQQSIAWSLDGVHFEKYAGNPVIPNTQKRDFRDPKIFRNEQRNCYGMVLAAGDRVEFYASEDLKNWEQAGVFTGELANGAVWECPDLFPITCQETGERKWILFVSTGAKKECRQGSYTWYYVGEFDGTTFQSEAGPFLIDWGYDNYAGVTWSGTEERVFLGWANNWLYADLLPTGEFCGQMTYARKLSLSKVRGERKWRLIQQPLLCQEQMPELQELVLMEKRECHELTSEVVHLSVKNLQVGESIRFCNPLGQQLEIGINGENCVYVDRRKCLPGWRKAPSGGEGPDSRTAMEKEAFSEVFASEKFAMAVSESVEYHDLEIYWDHSVLEVYADNGRVVLTMLAYPDEAFCQVERGREIKLAIFDMDGLMFDSENLLYQFYQEIAPEYGYQISREFYLETVGCNAKLVREITFRLLGEDFPLDEINRRIHEKIWESLETTPIPVKPGLYELLDYLKEQGIICVVASSSSEEKIRKYLQSAGVEQYFVAIANGNQVVNSKPDPDIFLMACDGQGVHPEEAFVLEDSQHGVLAAWRAGIPVICVPDMKQPSKEYAEKTAVICQDLHGVKDWLLRSC